MDAYSPLPISQLPHFLGGSVQPLALMLAISSAVYFSTCDSTSSVCSPSSGAGPRIASDVVRRDPLAHLCQAESQDPPVGDGQ